MITSRYPTQFELLRNAFLQNRLSHAYALSGMMGIGKTEFAQTVATFLLCEKNTLCGKCRGCVLMQANNHPDFLCIQPIDKSHVIKIDQIREMAEKIAQTAHRGGYQVVIISPADAMPVQAVNALLKTLEEPNGNVVIFLIDHQKSNLPETIMSRCQKIFFTSDIDLRLYNNELTLRNELLNHLEKIASRQVNSILFNQGWLKIDLEKLIQLLLLLAVDISRLQFGKNVSLVNPDVITTLSQIALKISPLSLQKFIDKLADKKNMIAKGINLNQQLCLEDLLIEWEKLF